jgi:hypothetical protein
MVASLDQAIGREQHESVANRGATHPQLLAQFHLHETLVGTQYTGEDIVTNSLVGHL